jgi:hypothetical protein
MKTPAAICSGAASAAIFETNLDHRRATSTPVIVA